LNRSRCRLVRDSGVGGFDCSRTATVACTPHARNDAFALLRHRWGWFDDWFPCGLRAGTIKCAKEGVKFSVSGDLGTGTVTHKNGGATADKESEGIKVVCDETVELTFALRYLNFFTKATSLSPTVSLSMSKDVPLVVKYEMEGLGHIQYFLAPKIDEDN
jgi:hypothetical protein